DASLQPVRSLGPSTVEYVASVNGPFSTVFHLLALNGVPPAATTLSRLGDLPIAPLPAPPDATQPPGGNAILTNDDRILDAAWSGDRLWATANEGCKPAGDNAERACGRLFGIDTASRRVVADAHVAQAGGNVFYPALSLDGNGDVVIVYGTSSPADFPAIAAVARTADGASTQPVTIAAPGFPHTGRRYGDYFGAATDPTDPSLVWVAGEIPKLGVPHGWGTEIAALTVSAASRTVRPDAAAPRASALASAGRVG